MKHYLLAVLGLSASLVAQAYDPYLQAPDNKYESLINYQRSQQGLPGISSAERNYHLSGSPEVKAADKWLSNHVCQQFDKVIAQNKFLPAEAHATVYQLHERAIAGETWAQTALADHYVDGQYLPKDWKTAICWYRAAAAHGSAYAEYWLGLFYQHGWVVPQSAQVSAYWFGRAGRHHNSVAAEREVAKRFANHNSGVYDMGSALVWYQRAAEQRDLEAELALGEFYVTSQTPSDVQRALSWYGKASAQHSLEADYNIGLIYYRGIGIAQDPKEAHKWMLRAAERGYSPAQYDLAEMYYQGVGVDQDWVKAYAWLEVSDAADKNPAARRLEENLITHFNPKQLTLASHLAAEYSARYRR